MSADGGTLPQPGGPQARLAGLIRGFRAELQTNRRAAAGLFAIALLVAGYGLLRLDNAIGAMRRSYIEKQRHLEQMIEGTAQTGWSSRAQESARLRAALEQKLWNADSEGVARANMEDWISRISHAAGLDKLQMRIEVARPDGLPRDLRRLTATITAAQSEPTLLRFLYLIARDPHLVVIDRLQVTTQPIALLAMTLSTYMRLAHSPSRGQNRGTAAAVPRAR